ncbi:very-long-chain 3-oxoacyl-CoA reductase-like [Portunus trituberculatus]|uniref:very-long-chain 3-oxoacyl-CoA reductase-like n=1 Tax=Portunus trituberculatus TaxID=210409 RepID=UPI001E1CF1A3|nr:very-long-chain 3-oxoacyl-CoA reductase-like [Portunus trituberculatus]
MWEAVGKAAVAVVVARVLWSLIKGIYGCFLASIIGLSVNLKKTGEWAVVSVSTDGIGKAYVFELARQGFKVVLVSRTPYKLQNVAAEVSTKYKAETKIIDVDFTQTNIYERLERELAGLDIGVLVNNVGMSYEFPEYFLEVDGCAKMCENLINCNIRSLTEMTRIVLPGMVERGRGLVLNLSSLSSTIPAPLLAVYGASKSYVRSFSESICEEVASRGVTVQCLVPGFVVSNMSRIRRPSLMVPSAAAYVRMSLRTAGVEKQTAGYFMHKFQTYFIELARSYLPGCVLTSIVASQLKGFRTRAHKKRMAAKSE